MTENDTQRAEGLILGLAPDIDHVGWAVIDADGHKVLGMGVHRFNPPLDPKSKVSLARKRRSFYYARINKRRTKYRAKAVLTVLRAHGLVPEGAGPEWLQSAKGERPVARLRAAGLDEPLSGRELAQVLYYLGLHRGYDPRGESTDGDADGKKMLSAIAGVQAALDAGEARTVGELMASRGRMRNRAGDYSCTATRQMIADEARALISAQEAFGTADGSLMGDYLDELLFTRSTAAFDAQVYSRVGCCTYFPDERRAARADVTSEMLMGDYLDELLFTRSTAAFDAQVYSRVGCCTYFPDERRAARADVTSEMLSAIESLKHLRIAEPDGSQHGIPHESCMRYLDVMFSDAPIKGNKECRVRYSDVLKEHGRTEGATVKGVLPADLKREVYVPRAFSLMRKAGVPAALLARMRDDRAVGDAVCEALTYASSEEVLLDRLAAADIELSDAEIAAICSLPYSGKVFSGYGSRSLKAQEMLLEMMLSPEVSTLFDAEDACGLYAVRTETSVNAGSLLPPYTVFDPTCTNPVVLRTTARMRRVVNAVIKRWGVPAEVRVILGRELKQSKKERLNAQRNNSRNRKSREELADTAASILGVSADSISGTLLRKLSLWRSQGGMDVLAGTEIDLERLCREPAYATVDYILPPARTGETGMRNSLLSLTSTAVSKGASTPVEWCSSGCAGAPTLAELKERVAESTLPYSKKSRILLEDFEGKAPAMLDRSVNDGRYASRAFRSYLEELMPLRDGEPKKSRILLEDFEGKAPAMLDRSVNDGRYASRAFRSYLEELMPLRDGERVRAAAVSDAAVAELRRVWGLNDLFDASRSASDPAVEAVVAAVCDAGTVRRCAAWRAGRLYSEPEERDELLRASEPWPSFPDVVRASAPFVIPTKMHDHGCTGEALESTNRSVVEVEEGTGYAVLTGATRKVGNYRLLADGTARVVGGMALIRIWHDPLSTAGGSRKGAGRYYFEPVYYADVPRMDDASYVPRYPVAGLAPAMWPEVPAEARGGRPIILHAGDVVRARGRAARYVSYTISGCNWKLADIVTGEPLKGFPSANSLCDDDGFEVMCEDVLGMAWRDVEGLTAL